MESEKVSYAYQKILDGTAGAVKAALKSKKTPTQNYSFYVEIFHLSQVALLKNLLQSLKINDAVVGTVELESPKVMEE